MYKLAFLFLLLAACNPRQEKISKIPVTSERILIESGLISGISGTDSTVGAQLEFLEWFDFGRPDQGI